MENDIELAAKEALHDFMYSISEEHYKAGWLIGLEYNLWEFVTAGTGYFLRQNRITERQRIIVLLLAHECNGWWIFDEDKPGKRFISLPKWEAMYFEYRMKKSPTDVTPQG